MISSYNFLFFIVKLACPMEASFLADLRVWLCFCFISSFFLLQRMVSKKSCGDSSILARHPQHKGRQVVLFTLAKALATSPSTTLVSSPFIGSVVHESPLSPPFLFTGVPSMEVQGPGVVDEKSRRSESGTSIILKGCPIVS